MGDDSYTDSALYYDGLAAELRDYAADADLIRRTVLAHNPDAGTLLDAACGTGTHLEFLLRRFAVEGLDLSKHMLRVARDRLPEVRLHQADMRGFDLGRKFDAVICVFSAIAYATTESELRQTLKNFARHLNAGGIVLVEPWIFPEDFEDGRVTAETFDLSPRHKVSRTMVSRIEEGLSVLDTHYLIGTESGVRYVTEEHRMGLFTRDQYRDALESAGFAVEFDPEGPYGRGLFVGKLG